MKTLKSSPVVINFNEFDLLLNNFSDHSHV